MSNPKFLKKRIKSIAVALQGIAVFFKTQVNAWIHLMASVVACVTGYVLKIEKWEWCCVVFAITLVFVTELLNTALEFLTDLASPSVHPLAKKVKDIGAGAVLVASITALVIAGLIFLPKLYLYH
jgi:diacylglycerol kinase (ATP)